MSDRSHDAFIRLPEVRRRTGLSTATIYRKMERGEFPMKKQLSINAVAWYESDLNAWIADPEEWGKAAA